MKYRAIMSFVHENSQGRCYRCQIDARFAGKLRLPVIMSATRSDAPEENGTLTSRLFEFRKTALSLGKRFVQSAFVPEESPGLFKLIHSCKNPRSDRPGIFLFVRSTSNAVVFLLLCGRALDLAKFSRCARAWCINMHVYLEYAAVCAYSYIFREIQLVFTSITWDFDQKVRKKIKGQKVKNKSSITEAAACGSCCMRKLQHAEAGSCKGHEKAPRQNLTGCSVWCGWRDLNPYPRGHGPQPCASADSATTAYCQSIIFRINFVHEHYSTVWRHLCQGA